jgi:hypothetical protein
MDAIALLREDHIKVLALLDELEAKSWPAPLKDSADRKRLVTELAMAESAHETIEEQFFWPSVQPWLKEGRQLAAPAFGSGPGRNHHPVIGGRAGRPAWRGTRR